MSKEYPQENTRQFVVETNFNNLEEYFEENNPPASFLALSKEEQIQRIVDYERWLTNAEAQHVRRAESGWCQ